MKILIISVALTLLCGSSLLAADDDSGPVKCLEPCPLTPYSPWLDVYAADPVESHRVPSWTGYDLTVPTDTRIRRQLLHRTTHDVLIPVRVERDLIFKSGFERSDGD